MENFPQIKKVKTPKNKLSRSIILEVIIQCFLMCCTFILFIFQITGLLNYKYNIITIFIIAIMAFINALIFYKKNKVFGKMFFIVSGIIFIIGISMFVMEFLIVTC